MDDASNSFEDVWAELSDEKKAAIAAISGARLHVAIVGLRLHQRRP